MAHLQYLPGDPHLVDQLVYELKSKGIFDQFRKDCIADVDTRPAYQNLRQRVETSVTTFLSRQCWQPDLNKNQLREKLRKHILDGNYLEQGVERIVDQVVNPKVASVFIPQVEDLVYNYLGITRKKAVDNTESSNDKAEDLLPTDLEAVSPGSVKSNNDKNERMDVDTVVETKLDSEKMEDEEEKPKSEEKNEIVPASETNHVDKEKIELQESELSATSELTSHDSSSIDKITIPLPSENIKLENIPPPGSSPLKPVEFAKKELSKDINCSVNIPLPGENNKEDKESYFKPINSDDDDSSSDSSLRRNMSPLTPIRNFNNENSCDAQQGFDNDSSDSKNDEKKEPNQTSSFRFAIEAKSADNGSEASKSGKKPNDQLNLAYQFNNQVTINTFNTPMYEDSSNSNLLHIDYESDANSKVNLEQKIVEAENSGDSKKERKPDERKGSHKSSHRSRDSHKHTSSKDRRSESKHSTSRDSSKQEKKSKEDTRRSKSNQKEGSKDKNDKKDSKESSRHSTHKSSSHKDSKSHKTSSSSQRHSSKSTDDKKSSSSHKEKSDKGLYKSSKDKLKESKSSSRSDKDKKSSNKSKHEDKDKEKKEKKESDDHYSLSGRGNPNRRSTDRDSNDGSSSSKGSHNPPNPKPSESKKDSKNGSSKSDNMTTTSESTSPSDRELTLQEKEKEVIDMLQPKPIVRLESHLETPIASPPNLAFVPDVKLKKPKFAANLEEAKKLIKMRKFLDEEQKRMNQEAALLLEFQANVRPSLSRIYSSIPGPELEFACVKHTVVHTSQTMTQNNDGDHENIVYASEQSNYAEDEGFSDHVEDDVPSTLTVREVEESIESINEELNNKAKAHAYEEILSKETYESTQAEDTFIKSERFSSGNINSNDAMINYNYQESIVKKKPATVKAHKKSTEYFEVTIITEEISDNGETLPKTKETKVVGRASNRKVNKTERVHPEQSDFHYFGEHEKYKAELERDRFSKFIKVYTEASANKVYLINCDTYEEKIVQEVLESFGKFKIVNYQRNGHLKLPKYSKNVVKDLNLSSEVALPLDKEAVSELESRKPVTESVFSPVKSECSFELSSDYDAKLEEMVNKTSRQEIMEIILGNVIVDSPTKMPKIDYFTDSNIESECDNNLKRKHSEMETVNNNRHILTPNKLRRLSTSDQISSTTEDLDERSNRNIASNTTRSKYLGRARRVGLSRPRKTDLPNSPSSDKSIENYEQNTPVTQQSPNGKIKTTPRNKVQRYDTSDLYKPKLHYLSRRNNIS